MSDDLIKPLSQWGVRELARAAGISPTTATHVKRGDVLDSRTMQAVMKVTGFCLCCGQNAADRIEQLKAKLAQAVIGLTYQLDAARADANEAEVYAQELECEIERLRSLVPRPDQTPDELAWRDHLRGVPLAKLAKDAGVTKERIRHRINKIHIRRHDTAINALRSIAANTCCENCQEAALVARTTLDKLEGKE